MTNRGLAFFLIMTREKVFKLIKAAAFAEVRIFAGKKNNTRTRLKVSKRSIHFIRHAKIAKYTTLQPAHF